MYSDSESLNCLDAPVNMFVELFDVGYAILLCCDEQLEDNAIERRTILRREEDRYLFERTVKHAEVLLES